MISQENHRKCLRKVSEETIVRQRNRLDCRHCSPFDKLSTYLSVALLLLWKSKQTNKYLFNNLSKQMLPLQVLYLHFYLCPIIFFRTHPVWLLCRFFFFFSEHNLCAFYVFSNCSHKPSDQHLHCLPACQPILSRYRNYSETLFMIHLQICNEIEVLRGPPGPDF